MVKKTDGFSAVELIIILVVVGLLAGGGWYVMSRQSSDNKKDTNAANDTPAPSEPSNDDSDDEEDITKDWLSVTSGKGAFTIKLPDGWKVTRDTTDDLLATDTAEASIIYKAGTRAVVTDQQGFGTGAPLKFALSKRSSSETPQGVASDFKASGGYTSVRYAYTYAADGELGSKKGDKRYTYMFVKGDNIFRAQYNLAVGDTDRLELVEQTLATLTFN